MNEETVLALLLPYLLSTVIYSILRFIYSVIIAVAIYKDAKRRTFSSSLITLLTFFLPDTCIRHIHYICLSVCPQ